jgi:hypothetical protein
MDDRDDNSDLLIVSGTPSIRRCGSLFVESIHKLKCGNVSKGVALMSQSDVSVDRPDSHSYRDVHIPSVDPLTVYPSMNVYKGINKNFVTIQCQTRRREDDASDDALTAPRRFLSPSHAQNFNRSSATQQYTMNTMNQTLMETDAVASHEHNVQPVNTSLHLSDIPECVVIPRSSLNNGMMDPFPNEDSGGDFHDFDSNEGTGSPFQPTYYDDIPISSSRNSARNCNWIAENNESKNTDMQDYNSIQTLEKIPSSSAPLEMSARLDSSTDHMLNADHNDTEWKGKYEFISESVPSRSVQYESHDRNDDIVLHSASHRDNSRKSDFSCYDSNASREFSICSEGGPIPQRTYYLASPTEETTKMSSLSKKLQMDHRRSIVLQASDTSFSTTKSGATLATSHSTSTGISRSSRKTQELIRRFERHGLQKAGHTTTMYDKGALKLPT